MNQDQENTSDPWILDSSITEHMTSDKSILTNLINYSSVVAFVNFDKIQVTTTGGVKMFICEGSGKIKNITFAYVPYRVFCYQTDKH